MRVVCNVLFEDVSKEEEALLTEVQDIFVHIDWLLDSISNYRPVGIKREHLLRKKLGRVKKGMEEVELDDDGGYRDKC